MKKYRITYFYGLDKNASQWFEVVAKSEKEAMEKVSKIKNKCEESEIELMLRDARDAFYSGLIETTIELIHEQNGKV